MVATPAFAADFAEVYRLARDHDPVMAEAQAKYEAAQQKPAIGRAGLLPTIGLSGNTMRNREDVENRTTHKDDRWNYPSHTYSLALTQPLFRWQNWVGYDQSKLVLAQAEAALANARQDLILRTAQAYFDVLQAQRNLDAAKAYQTAVGKQRDIAREAFRIGTGIKTDEFDAETRYELAASQVIASETELEVRQRLLESITGSSVTSLAGHRGVSMLQAPQPADMNAWVDAAGQGNLLIQQQRLAAEIADREVSRQRAGHLPTVDLVANTGHTSTLSSGQRQITDADRIGVQFNLPLFQGGEVNARTSEAIANRRAAEAALEAARRAASVSTRQAYLGVVNGLAQVKTMSAALTAAQQAVASNRDAFGLGVRLNIDVLNAQIQVFNAQRDLNRVAAEMIMAQLRLKAAVGTLGETDVEAINALLDRKP